MPIPKTPIKILNIIRVNEMQKYLDKLFKVVKQDGAFFFIAIILNLPILFQAFVGNKTLLPSLDKIFLHVKYFWCGAFLILLMTLAINFFMAKKKPLKKLLQRTLTAVFAVLFAAESFYMLKFNRAFDASAAEIFLENLFAPEVLIGVAVFVILLLIGIEDMRKTFKSMSAKKIKRLTYALIVISIFAVIFWIEFLVGI